MKLLELSTRTSSCASRDPWLSHPGEALARTPEREVSLPVSTTAVTSAARLWLDVVVPAMAPRTEVPVMSPRDPVTVPVIPLQSGPEARRRLQTVLTLMDGWIEEDQGQGDEEWQWLKRALDEDRPSGRKLFGDK